MKKILLLTIIFQSAILNAQEKDSLPARVYKWVVLKPVKEETRIRREIMEGSTTSLSYFEVHTSTLEPAEAPHPPHVHEDTEELMIVREGQVKITIAGTSKILGPGSIAFAMPGDEHGIENAGSTKATYYILKYKSREPMNKERARENGGSFMLDWNDLVYTTTDKGGRRSVFNRPTSQLGKFEMHTTMLNKGFDSHPPHTHKEEEIILLIRGNADMNIAGNHFDAEGGDLIFLSSGVSHNLRNAGDGPCEYFAFQWRN